MRSPVRAFDTPFAVDVEQGKDCWWCACGQSKAQPFCDGAHRAAGEFAPVKFAADVTSAVYFCGCKAAHNQPLCEGCTGQAFGFEWRASLWIPMFQFDANDLVLKAKVQSVREELPSLWSGWHVASWFAAANARLDGRNPAERLDSDPEAVVRAAQLLVSGDEFPVPLARRAHEVAAHV